jgi:hypothetical protein
MTNEPAYGETNMTSMVEARFVTQITVTDPDSKGAVELEIWKDPTSGGLVGIDASFLDQMDDVMPNPFNLRTKLHLREEVLTPEGKPQAP